MDYSEAADVIFGAWRQHTPWPKDEYGNWTRETRAAVLRDAKAAMHASIEHLAKLSAIVRELESVACPRCMPPGDPCCPYCGGTYGVDAPASQIIHVLRHDPEAGAIVAMRERMDPTR